MLPWGGGCCSLPRSSRPECSRSTFGQLLLCFQWTKPAGLEGGLGWKRGVCHRDAVGRVQHHLFNLLLSGTPVACLILNSYGTSPPVLLAWVLTHLECAVCQILYFLHQELVELFLLLLPPCVLLGHFVLLCQKSRGSDCSLEGSYSHLRAAAHFLRSIISSFFWES